MPPQSNAPEPVIIDTDPGVDDAIAILMALSSPALEVVGFTTTAGNVPLAPATTNALALLEQLGRADIPVHRGAARPVRGRYAYARHVHSASGLTHRLPKPTAAPSETGAVEFLAGTLLENPGEVSIIALGPLTNLARVMRRYKSALQSARRIIVMGGAVETDGNATPYAEFNFYSDPTAARMVVESGIPMTLIDLAPCRQVFVSRAEAEGLDSPGPAGKLAAQLLGGWFRAGPNRERFNLYDPLTLIAAVAPAALTLRPVTLAVEDSDTTEDSDRWGQCRVVNPGAGPISVAAPGGVDAEAARYAIRHLLDWQSSEAGFTGF